MQKLFARFRRKRIKSVFVGSKEVTQSHQTSFIGGKPRIPVARKLPHCRECGAGQTFFFQIEYELVPSAPSQSVAVFACTRCANENTLIPAYSRSALTEGIVSDDFLKDYQTNFAFVVFDTVEGVLREEYCDLIGFREISFRRNAGAQIFASMGPKPRWLLGNEAPSITRSGRKLFFLLQIHEDFEFETVEEAPKQISLNILGEPKEANFSGYQLFLQNEIYLFVTDEHPSQVYCVTQVD